MKSFIGLVALLITVMVGAVPANAHVWKHFGVDKAYENRGAAIEDAPRVMREAGWPKEVIALMATEMKHAGKVAHVTNGDVLDFMRSGPRELWHHVPVAFDKPPIKEVMEYSAPSEEWSVEWNGTVWTSGIPVVCRNLYGKTRPATPVKVIRKTETIYKTIVKAPPEPHCFSYDVDTRGNDNVPKPSMVQAEFYQQGGTLADVNRVLASKTCPPHAVDLETHETLGLVRYCYGCEAMTGSRPVVWPADVQPGTTPPLYLTIVRENGEPVCPSGHCRIFIDPFWPPETSVTFCFMAKSMYAFGKYRMFAYFYNITQQENAADVPRGHYHEVVTPNNRQ